ncbi:GAF domain-containing protein [Fulvivirga sp. RKSG066]|uniref:GAF domain-containing protein n=1 Tax=Fulvivirga aurantia TaxID=2529383 RepID=UPI0012BC5E60|nr:GAF domain-containing protein [Fulvivirga aurantia]MTI22903.1 GAF domain-containing protein [Fulvivirga aurantia]
MSKKTNTNNNHDFPFKASLNLAKLIEYWESNLENNRVFSGFPQKHIKALIDNAPELKKPIKDLKMLKEHEDLVGLLLSAVFPPAMIEKDLAAAMIPFQMEGFYATPGYREIIPEDKIRDDLKINLPGNDFRTGKIIHAGIEILNKFYGTKIEIDKPILVNVPDVDSGLERIYKIVIDLQFTDIVSKGELPDIDKNIIRTLLDNMYDPDMWLKYLKPEQFEFEGFSIFRLIDVTVEEMLSSIKYDLLRKDAVTCGNNFTTIQQKVRSIFKLPELKMGLTYFDSNNNIVSNYGANDWHGFLVGDDNKSCACFVDSVYDQAYLQKKPVVIENLEEISKKTEVEKGLIKADIKNIVIAPLIFDDEVIGMLEFGTPYVGKLNPVNVGQLENVLPMFTAAVRRVLGEMQTEVRAIIQEQCTAIHPAVEWKFLEEGYKILHDRKNGAKMELGNIVFEDVYPIYGMSDIRNSSGERSAAIQEDLKKNLSEVKAVIAKLLEHKKMPILDEISHRVEDQLNIISSGLNSGDESSVLDFLKFDIVPMFKHFKENEEALRPIIEKYEEQLDPDLGVIYDKRKDFEVSLTRINENISNYLDKVEKQAQEIFPHYFEKYKTDGVEYNIYLGDSLVKNQRFDEIYLRNMRLWQLITMCEIASSIEQLKQELPKKLDITQLILVHGDPLSIKFRQDEKHFDVDGAYNIRYEIVKKRIDKAFIKNTKERLTQPGKISIVYTQQREAKEYEQYINYLQSINYLADEVEYFELEELQGAQGLKAIRVEVSTNNKNRDFGNEILKGVIEAMEA